MINVRACVSDKGDIFDGPNADERVGSTLEERLDFVERQEKLALDYQGEAFRTYLAKRFADKRAEETLKSYMDQFLEAAPLPKQLRWLGRIRRLFGVVYASAAQAIDYGVLPWGKKATLKAILACMTDAMDQLTANFSDSEWRWRTIKSDDALVAEFKRRMEDAKFVRIERNSQKPHSTVKRMKKSRRVHPDYGAWTGQIPASQQSTGDLVSRCDDAQAPQYSSPFSRDIKGRETDGYKHTTNSYRSAEEASVLLRAASEADL